jgi:hypothetical protein
VNPVDAGAVVLAAVVVFLVGRDGMRYGFRNLPMAQLVYFWFSVFLIALTAGGF